MSFDARQDSVGELFNRKKYIIPRNQRKYVWKTDNWQELFEDVETVVEGTLPSHFIGSIVLKQEESCNGLPRFSIIDGQQRMITLTVFLTCILYWMRKLGMSQDYQGTLPYVIAIDDQGSPKVMVTTDSCKSLEKIIKKIIYSKDEEIQSINYVALINGELIGNADKNIAEVFNFYIEKIQKSFLDGQNQQKNLLNLRNAIRSITFVDIVATTEEDSYMIFEILNARGLDLENHELLKNYILRYIAPETNRDVAKEQWNRIEQKLSENVMETFISHYTTHKYGRQGNKKKSDYKVIQEHTRREDNSDLLDDIDQKSEYYLKLSMPDNTKETGNCSEDEYFVYSFLKRKRYIQMRPLFLSLISKNKKGYLSDKLYKETIWFLYKFFVCYKIIGDENSNRLTNVINKYSLKIENEYSDSIVEGMRKELISKLPSKESFVRSFDNIGWSHHQSIYEGNKNKERVQIILEILERHINKGYCGEQFTVEHVLPDSLSKSNGIIGNLIPLEEHLNQKCENKELVDKLQIYKKSSFLTARRFVEYYENQSFDPNMRTEYMANQFYDNILKFEEKQQ